MSLLFFTFRGKWLKIPKLCLLKVLCPPQFLRMKGRFKTLCRIWVSRANLKTNNSKSGEMVRWIKVLAVQDWGPDFESLNTHIKARSVYTWTQPQCRGSRQDGSWELNVQPVYQKWWASGSRRYHVSSNKVGREGERYGMSCNDLHIGLTTTTIIQTWCVSTMGLHERNTQH